MAFLPDVAGAFWRLALADVLILFARGHRPGEAARGRWQTAMASVDSQQIRCSRAKPSNSLRPRPARRQRYIPLNITRMRSRMPTQHEWQVWRNEMPWT